MGLFMDDVVGVVVRVFETGEQVYRDWQGVWGRPDTTDDDWRYWALVAIVVLFLIWRFRRGASV